MKRDTSEAKRGSAALDAHYAKLWGTRWPTLRAALLADTASIEWSEGLSAPYALDPASVLAALALGRPRGEDCLDLCAAPGGKALIIASRMEDSRLTVNERSPDRFMRMKRVLEEHLDGERFRAVRARRSDGASLCRLLPSSFDRILLDAPCSSERHVIMSREHAEMWTPARAKALPFAQWPLLSSAFIMLRPGGRLVYSTCSLNPAENEGVAARLLKKEKERAALADARALLTEEIGTASEPARKALKDALNAAEDREAGILVMPDKDYREGISGPGPMYIAVFERRE